MKLGYFTMPLHPVGRDWRQTLAEDREAVLLAERLGFEEAFIGEHVTDLAETITSCLIFIATLARDTKRIKLGSGTVNLANRHPAATAAEIAMVDTLLEGRFILGVGPGGLPSDAEMMQTMDEDRNAIFVEAMDHMIALWTQEPPYRLQGQALAPEHRAHVDSGPRHGRDAEAVPEAASADRGHRDPPGLERHRRRGRARLDADLRQLRATLGDQDALAEVRRGLRARRPRRAAAGLARGEEHLRRRRRGDACAA